jgi:hypothetical protein
MTEEFIQEKPLLERLEDGNYAVHHNDKVTIMTREFFNHQLEAGLDNLHNYKLHASTEIYLKKKRFLANFEYYMKLGIEKRKRGEKLIDNKW